MVSPRRTRPTRVSIPLNLTFDYPLSAPLKLQSPDLKKFKMAARQAILRSNLDFRIVDNMIFHALSHDFDTTRSLVIEI